MIPSLSDVALAVSTSAGLSLIVKSTVIMGMALSGLRLTRRAPASVRHVMLASMFAGLLCLPIAAFLLPALTAEVTRSDDPSGSGSDRTDRIENTVRAAGLETSAARAVETDPTPVLTADVPHGARRHAWSVVGIGWLVGAMFFVGFFARDVWRLRSYRSGSSATAAEVAHLAAGAGIRRRIDIVLSDGSRSPMTYGTFRPLLILPADASTWSGDDFCRALVHELEHIRRCDWAVSVAARFVCGLYWFHPLAWIILRRLHLEAERACDDEVIRGSERIAYADQLVTLAKGFVAEAPLLSMIGRSDLAARVSAVLSATQRRGRTSRAQIAVIATAAAAVVVGIAPLQVVARSRDVAAAVADPRVVFEAAFIGPNASGDRSFPNDPNAHISRSAGGMCIATGRLNAKSDSQSSARESWLQGTETCFRVTGLTLKELIAYAVGPFTSPRRTPILGGPAWADVDRFDIAARVSGNARMKPFDRIELAPRLEAMLEDRFKLATHHESRILPIYKLVLAGHGGQSGSLPRAASRDCVDKIRALRAGVAVASGPVRSPCIVEAGSGYIRGGATDMTQLVWFLSNRLNRVVLDQTGLVGMFEINLTWDSSASLVDDLPAQLGLQLIETTGPVDVVVIGAATRL